MQNKVKVIMSSGDKVRSMTDQDDNGKALINRLGYWLDENVRQVFTPSEITALAEKMRTLSRPKKD